MVNMVGELVGNQLLCVEECGMGRMISRGMLSVNNFFFLLAGEPCLSAACEGMFNKRIGRV